MSIVAKRSPISATAELLLVLLGIMTPREHVMADYVGGDVRLAIINHQSVKQRQQQHIDTSKSSSQALL